MPTMSKLLTVLGHCAPEAKKLKEAWNKSSEADRGMK